MQVKSWFKLIATNIIIYNIKHVNYKNEMLVIKEISL
jgi:hypothetical protein